MSEELNPKQKELEQLLEQEFKLSKKEKFKDLAYDLGDNAKKLIPAGLALSIAGLTALTGYELYQHSELISCYQEAYNCIEASIDRLSTVVKNGTLKQLPSDFVDISKYLTQLIEQGSHHIYTEAANQLLNGIAESKGLFSEGAKIEPALGYLKSLKEDITPLSCDFKSISLSVGTFFGLAASTLLGNMSINKIRSYSGGQGKLKNKKNLQKSFKTDMPGIRKDMAVNPNADAIYDFIDVLRDSYTLDGENLFKIFGKLSKYNHENDALAFGVISNNPEKYSDCNMIESLFSGYSSVLGYEESEVNKFKQLEYSKLYVSLVERGFDVGEVRNYIYDFKEIEENKEFFFNAFMNSKGREKSVSDLMSFYTSFKHINYKKKIAIADYLLKNESEESISQLKECKINNRQIIKYLETLDELPEVGIKGQVETLVKLNGVINDSENMRENNSIENSLVGLLNYKAYDGRNSVSSAKFLVRHTNVPIRDESEKLEIGYGNRIIEKKISDIINDLNNPDLLENKYSRQFIEELVMKTELKKYDALNSTIDKFYSK